MKFCNGALVSGTFYLKGFILAAMTPRGIDPKGIDP